MVRGDQLNGQNTEACSKGYWAVKKIERIIVDEYLRYLKETGEEDTIEPWITPEYFNHYLRSPS